LWIEVWIQIQIQIQKVSFTYLKNGIVTFKKGSIWISDTAFLFIHLHKKIDFMEVLEKIALSEKQIQKIESGGIVVIPASWDEFMDFLEETTYKAEYNNGRIIIMGLASAIHEMLMVWISTLLTNHYNFKGKVVYGSNLGVKTLDKKGYFNPDITVVKGELDFYNKSNGIIVNPYLVVEILSESTYAYDMNEKLIKYQGIPTLQEAIFVDRYEKVIMKFKKSDNPKVWIETIYDEENPEILIDTMTVNLNDIFDKIDKI
jgi:Uma2 family endonuclease